MCNYSAWRFPGYPSLGLADRNSRSRISRTVPSGSPTAARSSPRSTSEKFFYLLTCDVGSATPYCLSPKSCQVFVGEAPKSLCRFCPYSNAHLETFTGQRNKLFSPVFASNDKLPMDLSLGVIQMVRHLLPFLTSSVCVTRAWFRGVCPGWCSGRSK